MSAFISVVSPDAAFLFTDAAIWNGDQTLQGFKRKVWGAKTTPLAVSARGYADGGALLAEELVSIADDIGAAATIDNLQEIADGFKGKFGITGEGYYNVDAVVTAFIPGKGGVHRSFASKPQSYYTSEDRNRTLVLDRPAYGVITPGELYPRGGSRIRSEDIMRLGLAKMPTEPWRKWAKRAGPGIMELMRRRPGVDPQTGNICFAAGGWCDLTTVDAQGCRTEKLYTWREDRIGEKINAYEEQAAQPIPGMNRAQRRAAKAGRA